MNTHSRPEVVGAILLGTCLLLLALWLHDLQPGYWTPPEYGLPAVALAYAVLAVVLEGFSVRALGLFGLLVAVHGAYGAAMAAALSPRGDSVGPAGMPAFLRTMICEPYALLLQGAFSAPLVGAVLWPALARRPADPEALDAVGNAADAEDLLQALVIAQAQAPAEQVLARATKRAVELLAESGGEEPAKPMGEDGAADDGLL